MLKATFGVNGVIFDGLHATCPESAGAPAFVGKKPGKKRGSVSGFSSASARRLRQFLATHVGVGTPFAASLTFPFDLSPVEFRKRFHKFCVRSRIPFVWRVELTKRKRPHVHAVGWSSDGVVGIAVWQSAWWDIADAYIYRGGEEHACVVELLRGADWFKYLACHTSKHKEEQLGWQGRQWGVVRRGLLQDVGTSFFLTDRQLFRSLRVVRRLSKCRLLHYGNVGQSVWFLRPDTVSALRRWVESGNI